MYRLSKKAAMFGLDARIALAIFAALSVITGAVLYKAVQEAKHTSFYTTSQEIIKAYEQYYLDTGSPIPLDTGSALGVSNLLSNLKSTSGWKGPYLPYKYTGHPTYFQIKDIFGKSASFYIYVYSDEEWSPSPVLCSASPESCYSWLLYHAYIPSFDKYNKIFKYLDKKFDNNNGEKLGSIRKVDTQPSHLHLLIRIAPYKWQ